MAFSATPALFPLNRGWMIIALAALLTMAGLPPAPATAQSGVEPPPASAEVEEAIAKACQTLKQVQREDGSWVDYPGYEGASTALAIQALVLAGEPKDSPHIKRGIEALKRYNPTRTYSRSIRAMAYALLAREYPQLRSRLSADAAWLVRNQKPDGMWNYGDDHAGGKTDNSNTQFAVLGLRDAASANIEIPAVAWRRLYTHYTTTQLEDGGWAYRKPDEKDAATGTSKVTIVAPSVASLLIVNDELMKNSGCPCRAGQSQGSNLDEQHVDKGLNWLVDFFDGKIGAGGDMDTWQTYFYYGLLRAGQASGLKTIGKHDWYERGSNTMFRMVRRDCMRNAVKMVDIDREGNPIKFKGQEPHFITVLEEDGTERLKVVDPMSVVDVSLATIFLVKGGAPVLMNKLRYDGQWNRHRRDLAMITEHVSRSLERPLRWQVVDIVSEPETWIADSRLLYMTGEDDLELTDEQKERLKQFCRLGGTLLIEANCGNKAFMEKARALVAELWPDWPLAPLAKDHPLYNCQIPVDVREISLLEGVDDGVRTFVLLTDKDFSCSWQLRQVEKQKPLFDMALNLYAYATDKAPAPPSLMDVEARIQLQQQQMAEWEKAWQAEILLARKEKRRAKRPEKPWEQKTEQTVDVRRIKPGGRRMVQVALLDHEGNFRLALHYDVLRDLITSFQKEAGVALVVNAPMKAAALEPDWPELLLVRGDEAMGLDADAAKALGQYMTSGGFVIAEAAMGRPGFDADFRKVVAAAGLKLQPLTMDDAIITGKLPSGMEGAAVAEVRFTRAVQQDAEGPAIEAPGLLAIKHGDKTVGYYSPLDLFYSATSLPAYNLRGYDAQTASAMLVNMLLLTTAE